MRQLVGGGGVLKGGRGCLWPRGGIIHGPVATVFLPLGVGELSIKNTLPQAAGQAFGLRAEVNEEGGVPKVPKGLDEVGVRGGANAHQAGGHYGNVVGVMVDGAFIGADEGEGMGGWEWNELAGGLHRPGGGETQFIGLPAIGGVGGEGKVGQCCRDLGLEVAVCVFVGVGEGVELLPRLLRGGLVGREQWSPPGAHVEVEGGVGLRIGCGPGNFLRCLGVLNVNVNGGDRGVPVCHALQECT